jgi:hypothetical protein
MCVGLWLLLACGSPLHARQAPADVHLDRGYAHLAAGRVDSAVAAFRAAVQAEPERAQARAELGYALLRADRPDEALVEFIELTRLRPDDAAAWLQRGYLHAQLGEAPAARAAWERASGGLPADAAARAAAELAAAAPALRAGAGFLELYLAPQYHDRFGNFIATGHFRAGMVLNTQPRVELYGSVRATRDTRSTAGAVPVIYSDNVVVPAAGVRLLPLPWLALLLEAGVALPLDGGVRTDEARLDVRAGGFVARSWAPAEPGGSGRVGELYADALYFSRFDDNVIGSLQYRDGYRLGGRAAAFDVYARGGVVGDVRGDVGNRIAEAGVGVRIVPAGLGGWLGAEYVRGRYLHDIAGRDYGDLRILLIVSRYAIFPPRGGR